MKNLGPGGIALPELRLIRKTNLALVVCLCLAITAIAKHASKNSLPPVPKAVVSYDASRDPAKDLQDAIAVAAKANKRILLEVGGDWCVYCNIMDQTFDSHPQLRKVRDTFYVSLKVNYSKENPNDTFLSHYPKIADYPQFFVLDSKGALLHSQPTHPFEHGKKYNVGKIDDFLRRWSQPPRHLFNLEKTS
jgi:thiol:disulfide interchange protein